MASRRVVTLVWLALTAAVTLNAQARTHVLKEGETLYGLARTYGVPFKDLLEANKIVDPNRVRAGQKILIPQAGPASPAPGTASPATKTLSHTVQKGETLFGIARQYGVSVSELRDRNRMTEKSVLKIGDVLSILVPEVSAPPQAAPVSPPLASKGDGDLGTPDTRNLNVVATDPSVRWPIRVKELAYMEGKLYGVLITGEKSEPVESLTAGTVVSAEPYRGFGRVAIVQSPEGLVYVYGGHESLSVRPGDRIASGSELGKLGVDSLTGKPQLFLLVYKDNVAIDPAKAPRS